jgi:chorismate-pyruvate lyase
MSSESFFRSSGYLQDGMIVDGEDEPHPIADFSPFLRTLLVADGTVTKALEAFFWEPVAVQQVSQHELVPAEPVAGLQYSAGQPLLHREVSLTGRHSGRRYALARSILALESLPPHFAQAILSGKMGIGELLREQGVETYRDIVNLQFHRRGQSQDDSLESLKDDVVSRSYRISVSGVPAILVTEYFPVSLYST